MWRREKITNCAAHSPHSQMLMKPQFEMIVLMYLIRWQFKLNASHRSPQFPASINTHIGTVFPQPYFVGVGRWVELPNCLSLPLPLLPYDAMQPSKFRLLTLGGGAIHTVMCVRHGPGCACACVGYRIKEIIKHTYPLSKVLCDHT